MSQIQPLSNHFATVGDNEIPPVSTKDRTEAIDYLSTVLAIQYPKKNLYDSGGGRNILALVLKVLSFF